MHACKCRYVCFRIYIWIWCAGIGQKWDTCWLDLRIYIRNGTPAGYIWGYISEMGICFSVNTGAIDFKQGLKCSSYHSWLIGIHNKLFMCDTRHEDSMLVSWLECLQSWALDCLYQEVLLLYITLMLHQPLWPDDVILIPAHMVQCRGAVCLKLAQIFIESLVPIISDHGLIFGPVEKMWKKRFLSSVSVPHRPWFVLALICVVQWSRDMMNMHFFNELNSATWGSWL